MNERINPSTKVHNKIISMRICYASMHKQKQYKCFYEWMQEENEYKNICAYASRKKYRSVTVSMYAWTNYDVHLCFECSKAQTRACIVAY